MLIAARSRFQFGRAGLVLVMVMLLTLAAVGCAGEVEEAADAADADPPHVVFIIGEAEFDTHRTLPAFAEQHLHPHGIRTTVIEPPEDDPNNFVGLESAVAEADLVLLSVRRRALPESQMQAFRAYLEAGRPLVGIRTASHAFGPAEIPEGGTEWPEFDVQVLGGDYQMHYGNRDEPDRRTVIERVEEAGDHPILADWDVDELVSDWHLYKNRNLADDATLLLRGHITGEADETTEPVAWTHRYHGGRVFYTSLGTPGDFEVATFTHMLRNAIFWALDRPIPDADAAD